MRAGAGGREKTGGSPVINLQVVGWTQPGPDGMVWMSRSAEWGEGVLSGAAASAKLSMA